MNKRLFKGYSPNRKRNGYYARITHNGKKYYKYFKTAPEAEDWYEKKSMELYGFDRVHEYPEVNAELIEEIDNG